MLRTAKLVLLGCLLLGCGPAQEPKAPPPKAIEAPPPPPVEVPDLSPVTRSAEVFLVGRIARPRLLSDTLTKWSSLPVGVDELMPPRVRPLSRVVAWEAPIELLVALDALGEGKVPPPLVIGSIGLKSLDEALAAADQLQLPTRKLAPGIYAVGDFPDVSCAIAVSLGSAPARLICGRGTKDIDALLPYATRGLPNEPQTGADCEMTLDVQPLQEHYGRDIAALRLLAGIGVREIALDSQAFDRALTDAVYGSVDEAINLFNDLQQLRVEARIDASRNVLTGAAELRLRGSSSWTAGTIAASKPVPVPASLPRIPPGATLAAYNTSYPAERFAALERTLADLVDGLLEHEKLPGTTRKRARHLLDAWLSKMPESFGFVVSPTQHDALGFRHADAMVIRVSEPAARISGIYTDFFGLLTDPAAKTWVKQKKIKVNDKIWPKVTRTSLKLPGFKQPATSFELSVNLKAWDEVNPSVAMQLGKFLLPDQGDRAHLYVVIQPDGPNTYVMSNDDLRELARVVGEMQRPEPGVFFAKPARNEPILAAGFWTLAGVARSAERQLVVEGKLKEPLITRAVAAAPNHGETPIPISATTAVSSARLDFEIPAAAFADASAAAVSVGPVLRDSALR